MDDLDVSDVKEPLALLYAFDTFQDVEREGGLAQLSEDQLKLVAHINKIRQLIEEASGSTS
jgi:hypothetical protein